MFTASDRGYPDGLHSQRQVRIRSRNAAPFGAQILALQVLQPSAGRPGSDIAAERLPSQDTVLQPEASSMLHPPRCIHPLDGVQV